MAPRLWQWTVVTAFVALSVACTSSVSRHEGAPAATTRTQRIDPLTPPRDSTGAAPSRFEWTPVEGADRYAIGVWNEVDVLVWRLDDLRAPSVVWPKEFPLEPGTYYWSVTALREDRPVAESGLTAFVVRR